MSCLGSCTSDVEGSIGFIKYYASCTDKVNGKTIMQEDCSMQTRKYPVGVVAAIIPWNYPLLMAIWKIGPALAMGCTMVMKPSEFTPLTSLYMGYLVDLAGFPKGTLNIVCGYRNAGKFLAEHPLISKISFTGSTETGKKIIQSSVAGGMIKKVTLELGGKSPVIINDDANLEAAIESLFGACFANTS